MTNPFEGVTDDTYNPFAISAAPEETTNSFEIGQSNTSNQSYQAQIQNSSYDQQSEVKDNNVITDAITGMAITEKEIEERERALAKRESLIAAREREVEDAKANGTVDSLNPHKRNYPILISLYKYYPEEEIEEEFRPHMQKVYWLEYGAMIVLLLNAIGCAASFAVPSVVDSPSSNLFFGIIYLIFGVYLSLDLCVMVLYDALARRKALKFFGFLVSYAVFTIFMIYIAIGLNQFGSIGWITAIDTIGANGVFSGYCFIFSILDTVYVVALGWIWYQSFLLFRNTDFKKRAIGEAAGYAAGFAVEHREEITQIARENPEFAQQAASLATDFT